MSSQGYGFSSGHVWMWELDCVQSWAPKNWCFWTVVLEKSRESSLNCKEIQPVHPKMEGMMLKLKLQYFGHLIWRTDSLEKPLMLGKIEGRTTEKRTTEDEMVGWHHWLNGCERWAIKKAEHQRIDAFEPWCWRRLLRTPWPARRSNQSLSAFYSSEISSRIFNTISLWLLVPCFHTFFCPYV